MLPRPVLKLREVNPLLFNFVEELVEIRVGDISATGILFVPFKCVFVFLYSFWFALYFHSI
jgi:hypothetical protein